MKAVAKWALTALLAVSSATGAQQPAASPRQSALPRITPAAAPADQTMSSAQEAQLRKQDAELIAAARQVMALVDEGRIGEVWDGASSAMKRAVPRAEFVAQVASDRRRVGSPNDREDSAVTRTRYPAGQRVPQGVYANIATPTTFANAPQPVRELVSFRLDEDRTWRVSGYSLR